MERAATWNNWTECETLMQFAGYLCSRARLSTLHTIQGLEHGWINKTVADLDFQHITQGESKSVSNMISSEDAHFS